MSATYKNNRPDVTICTMLFKMPDEGNLASIKGSNRKFDEFYLPSLKKLCETFHQVALWCDEYTANYLKENGLADRVNMHVLDITQLPHWADRDLYCDIMHSMKHYVGYFLHRRTPEAYKDYLPLMFAKPAVVDWAAKNNRFNSEYFMWMDAGAFSPAYDNAPIWNNWTGEITARPERVRMTISITLGKSRPHFVPRFVYDICKFLFVKPIQPASSANIAQQEFKNIAMVNADYDVPGGSFMVPLSRCADFYRAFERAHNVLVRHNLICVDQGVFQTMMKLDGEHMFELKHINGYRGLYATIANGDADFVL